MLRCCSWTIIHVDSDKFDLSLQGLSQSIQDWFKTATVSSPGCRKIDHHGTLEIHHLPMEGRVCSIYRFPWIKVLKIKGLFASSAFQPIRPPTPGNAVLRAALRADGNDRFVVHSFLPMHAFNTLRPVFQYVFCTLSRRYGPRLGIWVPVCD